jgi:Ca-activated chloride channel family protein
MHWGSPQILLALWVLPVLALLLWHAQQRRKAAALRFAHQPMLGRIMPASGLRWLLKAGLVLLGLASLIIAAARPQFGAYFDKVSSRGADIFIVLDVSKSMWAEDVKPSRLERAKSDIKDFLAKVKGDRVGLIAFAGAPIIQVPLTNDHAFLKMSLDELGPDSAPRGGSLIGDAIRKAIVSLPPTAERDRAILLITDGEDQESYPLEAARQAKEQNIKIFAVGLGDVKEGARIPIRDTNGSLKYAKGAEGQEHWSSLNETLLKQIALETAGAYIPARTRAYDLGQIYEQQLAELTRGQFSTEHRKRYRERFQWFLAFGLICLAVEMLVPAYASARNVDPAEDDANESLHRNAENSQQRARRVRFGRPFSGAPTTNGQASSATPRIAGHHMALCAALLTVAGNSGNVAADARGQVRQGIEHFQAGDFAAAEKAFQRAEKELPAEARVKFDRACALAAAGQTDQAIQAFESLAMDRDRVLASDSLYNLGCIETEQAKSALGENPAEASAEARKNGIDKIRSAVFHFRRCLQVNSHHEQARHNLELLRLWTKHMGDVWTRRDRERLRRETPLLPFLEMIEQRQQVIRDATREQLKQSDSPGRRRSLRKQSVDQRDLVDELPVLAEKISALVSPSATNQQAPNSPSGQPPASSPPQPGIQQATARLTKTIDAVKKSMTEAAEKLAQLNPDSASVSETDALDGLNEIYVAIAPFEHLLSRATSHQQDLVDRSRVIATADAQPTKPGATAPSTNVSTPSTARPADGQPPRAQLATSDDRPPDYQTLASRQLRVREWTSALRIKARAMLAQLPQSSEVTDSRSPDDRKIPLIAGSEDESANEPADNVGQADKARQSDDDGHIPSPLTPADPPSGDDSGDASSSGDAQAARQLAALRQTLEKAIELSPEIERLTSDAADALGQGSVSDAFPKQERALQLLQEISKSIPPSQQKDDQQSDQGQQKQQQPDSDQKDSSGDSQENQKSPDDSSQDEQRKQGDRDQARQDKDRQPDKKGENPETDSGKRQDEQSSQQQKQTGKNESQHDRQQSPPDGSGQDKEQPVQARSLDQRELEGSLSKVRQREREYREAKKKLRALQYGPVRVERDW